MGTGILHLRTKFEVSSSNRSPDMVVPNFQK